MTSPYHPTIQQFQAVAKRLDLEGSQAGLNEALAHLAGWMELAADHLTVDDYVALATVGGMLYRASLRGR